MKKIYSNPKLEVVRIETHQMLADSLTKGGEVNNESYVLGHGSDDDFDW